METPLSLGPEASKPPAPFVFLPARNRRGEAARREATIASDGRDVWRAPILFAPILQETRQCCRYRDTRVQRWSITPALGPSPSAAGSFAACPRRNARDAASALAHGSPLARATHCSRHTARVTLRASPLRASPLRSAGTHRNSYACRAASACRRAIAQRAARVACTGLALRGRSAPSRARPRSTRRSRTTA